MDLDFLDKSQDRPVVYKFLNDPKISMLFNKVLRQEGYITLKDLLTPPRGRRNGCHGDFVTLFVIAAGVAAEKRPTKDKEVSKVLEIVQLCFDSHVRLVAKLREMSPNQAKEIVGWFGDWMTGAGGKRDGHFFSKILRSINTKSWNKAVDEIYEIDKQMFKTMLPKDSFSADPASLAKLALVAKDRRMKLLEKASDQCYDNRIPLLDRSN